jgi:DNA (cytosine-5)-methyltransferase 1
MKLNYNWKLSETNFTKDKGIVFSCFAGGGGSSMGYKLAGYNVIGCNEIDRRMMQMYKDNLNPKFAYLESIRVFKDRTDLPKELYNLDILDGSPPCSTFSLAGLREKSWGKEKMFREGQEKQILDTLFFDFIELAEKLQPKVVIAENVKGILQGNAISYVRRIYESFENAGYYCQHFVLDASKMGVPQKRQRVFFICLRKDLAKQFLVSAGLFRQVPKLELNFNEKEILFKEVKTDTYDNIIKVGSGIHKAWLVRKEGDLDLSACHERIDGRHLNFNYNFIYDNKVANTYLAKDNNVIFDSEIGRYLNNIEILRISSFPQDYKYNTKTPGYVCGMSVPPIMVARISEQVYKQWLSKMSI